MENLRAVTVVNSFGEQKGYFHQWIESKGVYAIVELQDGTVKLYSVGSVVFDKPEPAQTNK